MVATFAYIRNNFFALTICVIWLFPVTYFGHWTAPVGTDVFSMLKFPLVSVALLFILIGTRSFNWRILLFLAVAMMASLNSVDMVYSIAKFAGLAVVIGLFSPLIRSKRGREIREKLWNNLCWSAVAVVLLSLFWKATSLPTPVLYTKAGFPGITSHAMLFGPIAGIAAIFLLSKALVEKNYWIMTLGILCYLAVFLSLSRCAIAAATVGVLVVFMISMKKRRKYTAIRLLLPFVFALALLAAYLPEDKIPIGFGTTNVIAAKGLGNSRAKLWEVRMEEFKSNPVLGVGIGLSGASTFVRGDERGFAGSVEPGSGYLVMLSMTGLTGAVFLVFAILVELKSLRKYWQSINPLRQYELTGIGTFLFVHAGAEGWIYSPGGIMCLYFWLWLGMVGDSHNSARYYLKKRI